MPDPGSLHSIPIEPQPAAHSTAAGSIGQVAAEIGAQTLKDLELATLSPAATRQLAHAFDQSIETVRRVQQERAQQGATTPATELPALVLRVVATTLGLIIAIFLVVGVLYGLRVMDRIAASDTQQSANIASLNTRFEEARTARTRWEAERAEAEVERGKLRKAERELADRNAEDLELLKRRQAALVVHLLDSVELIAKHDGVKLSKPNSTLRLAKAEAESDEG